MDKDLTVISNAVHVTVVHRNPSELRSSIASCDKVDDIWWINRVKVEPPDSRRRGIGSRLLQRLVKEAVAYGGPIRVCPGGYMLDPEDQNRFYEKNGFHWNVNRQYMEYVENG